MGQILRWPDKDPDERLDYQINWSARLSGDTIASSTWIVDDGIVNDSAQNTTTITTIWISGGTVGTTYNVTNRITTAAGRIMDQDVKIRVA